MLLNKESLLVRAREKRVFKNRIWRRSSCITLGRGYGSLSTESDKRDNGLNSTSL
jgi:hypothetical protein